MSNVLSRPIAARAYQQRLTKMSTITLRWSSLLLVATVWTSAALFGLYILAFYAAALYKGDTNLWNEVLPGLYEKGAVATTSGIGLHFATGGIILVLGSIQLIKGVRACFPALHRWIGRLYILSSLLAAVGGLVFILLKGTIGGVVMDLGFGLYGVLRLLAAVETYRHAKNRYLENIGLGLCGCMPWQLGPGYTAWIMVSGYSLLMGWDIPANSRVLLIW